MQHLFFLNSSGQFIISFDGFNGTSPGILMVFIHDLKFITHIVVAIFPFFKPVTNTVITNMRFLTCIH